MGGLTEFVSTVIGALNNAAFPYLVTGSFASMLYSEPRTTMDIDVVVHAPFPRLEEFRQHRLVARQIDREGRSSTGVAFVSCRPNESSMRPRSAAEHHRQTRQAADDRRRTVGRLACPANLRMTTEQRPPRLFGL